MRRALSAGVLTVLVVVAGLVLYGYGQGQGTSRPHPGAGRPKAASRPTPALPHNPAPTVKAVSTHHTEVIPPAVIKAVVVAVGSAPQGCVIEDTALAVIPGITHPWVCYTDTARVEVGIAKNGEIIARRLTIPAPTLPPGATITRPRPT